MKSVIVPAQITTVEDKIVGNLTFMQLLLLVAPLLVDAGLYSLMPPSLHFATYKFVSMLIVLLGCGLMAWRVKGKLLLLWTIILLRYNLRPQYHVFNKNVTDFRLNEEGQLQLERQKELLHSEQSPLRKLPPLSLAEVVQLEHLLTNPDVKLAFERNKKGILRVTFTEIE